MRDLILRAFDTTETLGVTYADIRTVERREQTVATKNGLVETVNQTQDLGFGQEIQITNVNLEPGEWTVEDLIADTESGVHMEANRSWSIDDRRLNFQFGTELAYEIKNGNPGRLLKNGTYTGMTPEFWGFCDAIYNADH